MTLLGTGLSQLQSYLSISSKDPNSHNCFLLQVKLYYENKKLIEHKTLLAAINDDAGRHHHCSIRSYRLGSR